MGYNGTPWSKSQYYRRLKKAKELGCSIYDVPDMRGKHGFQLKGNKHHRWNRGKIISAEGYVKVRVGKAHPLADPNGYAHEHYLVWVSAGNRFPRKGEVIHHANEQKDDNRLENLKMITRSEHNAHHNKDKDRDINGRFVGKKAAGRLLDGREWNEYPDIK